MITSKPWRRVVLPVPLAISLLLALDSGPVAKAEIIVSDFSTSNAANWKVTGAGASAASPVQLGPGITITSTASRTGTFISGGSLQNFNGFWYAEYDFTLPAEATDLSLTFSGLVSDDRVVFELNGTNIGNQYLNGSEAGVMSFSLNALDVPFVFTNVWSDTVTSGFLTGENTLRLIVNNTDNTSPNTPTRTFQNSGDYTYVAVAGTLSFGAPQVESPEPVTLSLLALGGLALIGRRRHGN